MKKYSSYLIVGLSVVALAFSTGSFIKVNAATEQTVAGQPVDLTYASQKALPAVVHIKYVQNSKVQTVEVQSDPFSDFFSDPFGFSAIHRAMEASRSEKSKLQRGKPQARVSSLAQTAISSPITMW